MLIGNWASVSEQVTSVDNRATSFKTAKIVAEKLNPKYLLLNSFVCQISHRQPSQQLQIPLRQSAAALWCVYATQALSVRAALYFVSIGIKYNVNREETDGQSWRMYSVPAERPLASTCERTRMANPNPRANRTAKPRFDSIFHGM